MTHSPRIALAAALLLGTLPAAAQVLPVDAGPRQRPDGRSLPPAQQDATGFEVIGRGAITWTRSTGLDAFRGRDGRDYVYVATSGECPECVRGRMYVWDVTDPAQPVLTDSVEVDATVISDVAVNEAGTLAVLTRQGATSRRNGMVFLDLSEPAHPRVAGEYWERLLGGAHHPSWSGSLVFAVDAATDEMVAVDAADPQDPREAGRWGIPMMPEKELHHVSVHDGLAFLAYGDDGLLIVDIGNGVREGTLRRPRLVAHHRYRTEWRGQRWGNTHWSVPFVGEGGEKLLFVADEILPRGAPLARRVETAGYLHVLDISNPSAPREVGSYAVPGAGIRAMALRGDTLLLAAHGAGVHALHVAGTLRGSLRNREIGRFGMGGEPSMVPEVPYAWDVAAHNGLVFATDANSGLWIARPLPAEP